MDGRNKDHCSNRQLGDEMEFRTENNKAKPRNFHRNGRIPRNYQNDKILRKFHQNDRKSSYYHQNDKDVRPQSYRKVSPSIDRDDRPKFAENDARDRGRKRNTWKSLSQDEQRFNYPRYHSILDKKNYEKKDSFGDEHKKWNNGLQFSLTSDKIKPSIHWQTKEQINSCGLVRKDETGQFYKSILKASRSQRENRRPRSKSVCFSEEIKNENYLDNRSKDDLDIDWTNRHDDFERKRADEAKSEKKLKLQYSIQGISLDKSDGSRQKSMEHKTEEVEEFEMLAVEPNEECSVHEAKDDIVKEPVGELPRNDGIEAKTKLNETDKTSILKPKRRFHGFGDKDLCNDLRQLQLRTSIIKLQNKYEESCQEFAQNTYDVIADEILGDNKETLNEFSHVDDAQNPQTLFDGTLTLSNSFQDYLIPLENILEDDTVHTVDTIALEGIFEDDTVHTVDTIPLEGIFEDDTVHTVDTIPLEDDTVQMVNTIPLEDDTVQMLNIIPLEDDTVHMVDTIPLEDIFKDDTVHVSETDGPLLRSQDQEFHAEANAALSDVFTALTSNKNLSEMSRLKDYDLISTPQESFNSTQPSPTIDFGLGTIKMNQSFLQSNNAPSVCKDLEDNSEMSNPLVAAAAAEANVENQETSTDTDKQTLNNNNSETKNKRLKMKISKVEENQFKVENIEGETGDSQVQTGSPQCVSTTLKSNDESKESTSFSASTVSDDSSQLGQLPSFALCSVCSTASPTTSREIENMTEDSGGWQCKDCAVCILCFIRKPGERLLMCCKCGNYYHKTCQRVEQRGRGGKLFVCKFCIVEKN